LASFNQLNPEIVFVLSGAGIDLTIKLVNPGSRKDKNALAPPLSSVAASAATAKTFGPATDFIYAWPAM
jgi:hypothetical protein